MENQNQNNYGLSSKGDDGRGVVSPDLGIVQAPLEYDPNSLSSGPALPSTQSAPTGPLPFLKRFNPFLRFAKRADIALAILLVLGMGWVLYTTAGKGSHKSNQPINNDASVKYQTQNIPLAGLAATTNQTTNVQSWNVTINGSFTANGGFVITPTLQPSAPIAGQMYYNQSTNKLEYYNGSRFVILDDKPVVENLGGITGQVGLAGGLAIVNNQLINTGVLSLGGSAGTIALGNGLNMNSNVLQNTGVLNLTAGTPNVTITNNGGGNLSVSVTGSGTGTVSSGGGTIGAIPVFTASQNIEDSLLSQSGGTVTVTGSLNVTGSLSLGSALSVANGGTGAASLTANGVIVGNGAGALSSVAAGSAGLCLVSTAGAPAWGACSGGTGVTSLNALTGALNIANASAAGSTITIDDASTVAKGIASFNSTNFTVASGAVNTIQNINSGATPTFAGVNTNSISPSAALTVGVSGQTALLQGSTTTITSNGVGNNIILNSAGTIELQDNTNVTGNLDVSGTLTSGTANAFQVDANGNITAGTIAANGGSITSTGALSITPGGALTVGASAQNLTLQGNASTSLRATNGANTTIVGFTSPTANTTLNFPALAAGTYTVCTSSGNCSGAGVTLQSAYNNSTSPEIVLDATRAALTIRDTAGGLGSNLLEVQDNSGATTYLAVTASGVVVTGTASISGNINSSGGSLQTNGTTRIDNGGNATNIGNVSLSGSISGGTSYSGSGNINTTGGTIQTNSTSRIDNSGNLVNIGTITTSGAINGQTISSASIFTGTVTIQGANSLTVGTTGTSTGSVLFKGGTAASGTLTLIGPANPSNNTLTLPNETGTLCSTGSVCAGYAPASGSSSYASTALSNLAGVAINTTLLPGTAGTVNLGSGTLPFGDAFLSGTSGTPGTNNFRITGASTSGTRVITLPDATGTVCLQNSASCGFAPTSGSANYIQNQIAADQAADFRISGDGRAATFNGTTGVNTGAGAGTQRIDASGNLVNIGTVTTSGAINSQTISSAANFTGTVTIQGTNALTLGTTGTNTGAALFKGSTAASGTITLIGPANPTNNTLTLPNETGTLCSTGSICTGYAPASGSSSYANTALSNLASVAINTTLLPGTAGTVNLGSGTLPFGDVYIAGVSGTPGTNNFRITGTSTSGTRVITLPDATGTVCIETSTSCGFAPTSGSANYIQNQNGTDQAADFRISGNGRAATFNGTTGVNTGAGAGTQRIDASGNLLNIGNITASGTYNTNTFTGSALTFGSAATATIQSASSQALTLTANAASTWSTSAGDLTVQAAANLNLKAPAGNVTVGTTDSTGTLLVLDVKNTAGDPSGTDGAIYYNSNIGSFRCYQGAWTNCITASGGFVSLQNAYDNGNTISTDATGDIAFTLNNQNFTVATAAGASGTTTYSLTDGANATPPSQLVLITNNDINQVLADGLKVTSAAGGITTAIDVSGANITNAINIGANAIAGTNFSVTGAGAVTGGTYNSQTISSTASFTGTVTVASDLTLTSGDIAVNGGNITSTGTLSIDPVGAFTAGATGSSTTLRGSTTSITSNGAGNDITLTSADQIILDAGSTIELQDNTNITGNLDVSGTLTSGTANAFQVDASGNVAAGTYNTNTFTSSSLQFGAAATASIQSAASQALTITANAASTWSTSSGNLTVQSAADLNFKAPSGNVVIGTSDTTGTLLVVDVKTNAGDPAGTNGAIYYNSNTDTFRCYQGGAWANCITASGGFVSLQNAYDNGNTISTDASGDIAFTLNNQNFTIATAAGATGSTTFSLTDGSNASAPSQLVLVTNNDVNEAIASGLTVSSAAGGITNGIDLTDTDIVNAINIGDNTIKGTTGVIDFSNFDVLGTGALTAFGVNSGSGLLQGTGGLTITGGVSLNNNANNNVDVNTGTSTGTITLGGGSAPLVINSTNFDVSSAGALSGITTISTSSTINSQTISSAANFTGTLTVQGASITSGTATQQGSLILQDGNGQNATISVGSALAANTALAIPTAVGASDTFCLLTLANCVGTGGGVSGSGTNNQLAKFTSTGSTVGDSTISDNGSTVTTSVNMVVQGGNLTVGTTSQVASLILHDGNGQTTTLQAGNSVSDLTFIFPTAAGSANQCLKQSGTGNQLFWDNCDGGAGGTSVTLQNAYDNSTNPEITVDTTRGALTVRDNATPIGANLLEVQDNAGTTTYLAVSATGTTITTGLTLTGTTNINTSGTAATSIGNGTGALTATGSSSSTFVLNGVTVDATEFNRLDGKDAALVDTNDAVNTAITGTGALGSGSITSGFGSIDTGTDNITTTGTLQGTTSVLTSVLDRVTAGTLTIGNGTATQINLGTNVSITGSNTFTSGTGTVLLQGNTDIANTASLATKRAATYTTAGSANDVALNVASLYILDTSGAAQTITGIAAGRDGQYLTLVNADAALAVTLKNLNGSSAAANQISTGTGADVTIPAGGSIGLIYDTANNLWRVIAGASGTCASCANTALSNLSSTNINTALNTTSGNLNLTTTTSGNIVLNSAGTIELQDNTNVTGTLTSSSTLTVTTGGLTVSAGGASIAGNTTIATSAGNTLGLGNSTGTLTVTGNSSSTFVINGATVDATEFNRLDGKDAALVDTNDAVNTAITGTGALNSGSITSGFGSIDTGADNITTTGTLQGTTSVLTQSLDRTSAGALNIGATTATSIVLGQNTSLTGAATFTSGTGTVLLQGNTDIASTVSLATKRGATYTTPGSANDVALSTSSLYILDTSGAAQTITGIAAGRDGQHLTLVNADASSNVTLSNLSGSSSASNQISTGVGVDVTIAPGASIDLVYDTANSLWRVVGGTAGGAGTCPTCANQQLSNLSSTNINTALNATSGNLNLTTTTSGNIVLNSAGTIELQDNTNVTGTLTSSSTLTVTTGGLTVSAGGASISGNTTIATSAGNTLGLGNSTGTLTVTGNSSTTFVLNGVTVDTTEFNRLDGKDAALVDTNDAVNTAITGTGALNSGSITGGFGSIDTGADNISTTGTLQGTTSVLTSVLDRVTAGTLTIGNGTATQINLGTNVTVTGGNTFTSGTGTVLLQGNTDIAATASLATKRAATYTTAGSANDVALNVASLYILDTSGAAQTITGIAAGRDGQYLTLVNADATLAVTLKNMSGSSAAANQISTGTGADVSIPAGGSANLIYDTANNLWRLVGGVAGGSGTCPTCANQQLSNLSSVNLNTALNATSTDLNLTTTTSGNIVLNSAGTIELQDNTNVTGTLTSSSTLTVTTGGLTVSAGGASIAGNTTISTTAGNTLGLGNSTGALTVTGSSSSTFVLNGVTVDATEFNRLDGKDAALVDTNDAVNTAITGTGALNSGSITSGFGSIDTGADNITTTGTLQGTTSVLTSVLDRVTAGTLTIGNGTATQINLGTNVTVTGSNTFTSGTGTVLLQGNTDIAATASLATKRAATYTTAGSANDVALNVASLYILDTSGAAQTITGIAAGRDGQRLTLVNADAALDVTLSNLNGSSSASNQISTGTGSDVTIAPGGSIELVYDTANNLWRAIGGTAGGVGTCPTCANTSLSNLSSVNINSALNATSANLNLTTTTSGNIVLNSAGTIELQDNTNVTGTLTSSSTLTVTTGGLTVSAGGASIVGNTTIATTAGNTLGLGNSTGALTVTGSSGSTFVLNGVTVDTTEFNRLDGKDAALVDTNDAVNTAITGTGALNSGSITSGFGSIDTGADNITTTGTLQGTTSVLTQSLDRTSAGALNIGATTATSIVLGQNTSLTGAATFTSGTGTVLLQGNTDIANTVSLATRVGATFTTAGTSNNAALNVASFYLLDTSGAAQVINGITAGRDGQRLTLTNVDAASSVTLTNNSGSATGSKIITGTGSDVTLGVGASVELVYDSANSIWRVVGGVAGGTCSTCANTALSNLASVNINTALNSTSADLNLTTTTSGNIVLNSAGTIELQDNTNVTGTLTSSSTLTVTTGGLTVSAGGASIAGNTTIATTAGNTLGLGNSTGALTVTGSSSSTFVLNGVTVDATEFNRLDGKDASLVDTNDAVNTAITGTGALNAGSITSGFGSIDTGADNITTTGTLQGTTSVLTQSLDRTSAGALNIGATTATSIVLGQNTSLTGAATFTSGTGTVLLQGNTDIAATVSLATKVGATFTTAGTSNNATLNVASFYLLDTSGAAQVINGITAGRDGQRLTLTNVDAASSVTLTNNSGAATGSKIITGTGSDVTLGVGASVELVYDSANSIWRVLGGVAGGICSTCANTALSNLASTNINTALNTTAGNLNLTTTTSGNIVLNSAGTIELQDNTNVTGTLTSSSTLTVTTGGLTVSAGGASIAGNTTIATTAGNTLGLGNSTGALTVTGSSSSTFVINGATVDATEFNRLDGKDAALVDTNDAVSTAITGTGTLTSGALGAGFTTVAATLGGTGQSSYAVGDLLFANTTTTLSKLADVAVGSCLISGGVNTAPSWGSCGSTSGFIVQAPTTTAQNTIQPATTAVVGLTVNGTNTGTAAQALIVNQNGSADAVNVNVTGGTQTNGVTITRTNAGTTTNALNITNTSGTVTNGVSFSGTIGTDITRGSGTLTLQGAGGVTITAGTTNTISLDSAGAGTISLGTANATTLNIGSAAPAAARSTTIAGGNAGFVDTINIGTGAGTVAGAKTIHIGDGTPTGSGTNLITIGSVANTANVTTIQGGNGAGAITLTPQTTGTIVIGATAGTGNITLGSSTATQSVLIGNGTGASTVSIANNVATATGNTVNIASGNTATGLTDTINIGAGNTVGTGAKVIHIGDGTPAGTNTITIGSNANTANVTTIKGGNGAGAITFTPQTTGTIVMGAAAGTGSITLGSSTATQTVIVGGGTGASTVQIANNVATATGNTVSIAGGATATGLTDTVNIATGNTVGTGAKAVHIADGTPAGTNSVTIGAIAATANTTTIQGGNGAGAISIQTAASGTIGIGTNNTANTVQIGSTTLSSGTQTINIGTNNTVGGTTNVTIGTGSSATGGTLTLQAKGTLSLNSATGRVTIATGNFLSTSVAGVSGAAAGDIWYDSTAGKYKINEAGTTKTLCNLTDLGCGTGGTVTLQTAYNNGNTILMTTGNNITITSPDVATDPSFIFNTQCTTCSASGGRFAIQNAGSDVFTVSPVTGSTTVIAAADNASLVVKRFATAATGRNVIDFQSSTGTSYGGININGNADLFFGGGNASYSGTTGENTSYGVNLQNITTGGYNTAVGFAALNGVTTGQGNVGVGLSAANAITGNNNVAVGANALQGIVTGDSNVAVGNGAGFSGTTTTSNFYQNAFLGYNAGGQDTENFLTTDIHNSVALGESAQVQASNTIVIGAIEGTPVQTVIGSTMAISTNTFGVSPKVYNTGTASQSTTTITGVGTSWQTSGLVKVGMRFIFANGTDGGTITAITNDTHLTVTTSQTVTSQKYRIHNIGFQVTNNGDAYVASTSTTAFQVQTAAGTNVFSVDTSGGSINLNPASTGDVVATLDADSNFQFNATGINANINPVAVTATYTGDQTSNSVDITLTDNSSASTGTLYGLNVNNADNGANTGVADAIARFINNQATETVADGVLVQNNPASGTLTNGLRILQNTTGGTTTNGIQIQQSNGTLSNGILLAGTLTNGIYFGSATTTADIRKDTTSFKIDLNNASNSTLTVTNAGAGVASISLDAGASYTGAGALTVSSGGSADLTLDSASGRVKVATGDFLNLSVSGVTGAAAGDIWYDSAAGKFKINEATGGTKTLCNLTDLGCGTGGGGTPDFDQVYAQSITNGNLTMEINNASGLTFNMTTTGDFILQDNGTTVLTVADDGTTTLQSSTNSATAFRVLTSTGTSSVPVFTVDTSTPRVIVGDTTNGLIFDAASGPLYKGTARPTKTIVLNPEYPGSVLDAAQDASCSSANNGTMTSGLDVTSSVNRNLYQWVTSQAASQCYDVVVNVPLPKDFDAWASSNPFSLDAWTNNTTDGTIKVAIYNSSGTQDTNFNYASYTPGSTSTWTVTNGTFAGTYTAGTNMTIRIRMSAKTTNTVKLSEITLTYLSKF